jgi:DNA-binding LytR/AlgR family response regulator
MIRTIAIDDEPLALQLLAGYIKKTPSLELVGEFDNPLDAAEFLKENQVDLMFLDIQMPDLTGVEFVRILENAPKLVFTTAYEQYAIEGFKLDAIDYLLKPFSYEEFYKASEKAVKQIQLEQEKKEEIAVKNDFLFLKSEYKVRRIRFEEIQYIEGLKDYIKVVLRHEEKAILSLSSLKAIESKLPESNFMRVHKSFIVNLDCIDVIERSRIVFGDVYIPVGEQYKTKFQEFLKDHFL